MEKQLDKIDICKNCDLKIHMIGKKLIKIPEIIAEIASTHNGSKIILEKNRIKIN